MPPHNHRAPKVERHPTGNGAHGRRSCTRVRIRTGTLQDKKHFDLDVSGSEDDSKPPDSDHGRDVDSTSQGENSRNHVNDPNTIPSSKNTANDINHFFDRSGDKAICKICRQVFLHS
jgi:hypothetical protein